MGLNGNLISRYSGGAILLHWLIAFALAAEIAIGFAMPRDFSGFALFQLHKSIGITILLLSVARVAWRLTHKRPAKVQGGVTGFLASAVHVLFYAFMILAPLTGWAIVSSAELNIPTLLFGVVPWPHLPISQALNHTIEEAHELLAFLGLALFVLHVVGALKHQFASGGNYLARMAPAGKSGLGLLMGAGVTALGVAVFFGIGSAFSSDEAAPAEEAPVVAEVVAEDALTDADEVIEDEVADEEPDTDEADEEETTEEAEAEEVAAEEPAGPPPVWTIQPGGSLRFSLTNGDMRTTGSFGSWGGSIVMDPDNPEAAELAIDIQIGSATLGDPTQDQMVRGVDFFSTDAFPTATWRSTSVTSLGGGRYRADGTLSLKGASSSQAITFTLSGSGNTRSVSGQAVVNRNAFLVGVGSNSGNLGAEVALEFTFDAAS